jgi:hypothetical protein
MEHPKEVLHDATRTYLTPNARAMAALLSPDPPIHAVSRTAISCVSLFISVGVLLIQTNIHPSQHIYKHLYTFPSKKLNDRSTTVQRLFNENEQKKRE